MGANYSLTIQRAHDTLEEYWKRSDALQPSNVLHPQEKLLEQIIHEQFILALCQQHLRSDLEAVGLKVLACADVDDQRKRHIWYRSIPKPTCMSRNFSLAQALSSSSKAVCFSVNGRTDKIRQSTTDKLKT
jgi:hypothetical protein